MKIGYLVCRGLFGLALLCGWSPGVQAQDLAAQLYATLSAPQRSVFDALGTPLRLSGSFGMQEFLMAQLPDSDMAFDAGEPVFWDMTSAETGTLYLIDIGASGAARLLLPNGFAAPTRLVEGQARRVPSGADGLEVFMSPQSSTQVWLALLIPLDQSLDLALSGDPRRGVVQGGSAQVQSLLEQRINDEAPFAFALTVFGQGTPPLPPEVVERALALSQSQAASVQAALNDLGFNVGVADGLFGRNTRAGLRGWQDSAGLDQTGYLNAYSYSLLTTP